jgi:hypothetical protein
MKKKQGQNDLTNRSNSVSALFLLSDTGDNAKNQRLARE